MKKIITLIALASVVALSACNTAKGIARDTYGVGKFAVNQMSGDDN